MKLLGGTRINGTWRKRYASNDFILEIEIDALGNRVVKWFTRKVV